MACGSSKGKRHNFSDSDEEFNSHRDIREDFFSNSSSSKRKDKDVFTSDTDLEDEPIDKFRLKWKKKPRRGIIHSDSDFDDFSSDRDDYDNKSGDDNVCPICLGEFENQLVGIPENCEHTFCIDCIQEWSKNANNCPVDRKKFNLIRIRNNDGDIIQEVVVEDVKSIDEYEDPPTYCQVCNQCDREDCMLLCDGCDNGYHMDCLSPPLEHVPIENWFCVVCAPPPTAAKKTKGKEKEKEKEKDKDKDKAKEKWDDFIDDSAYYDDNQNRNQSDRRRSSRESRGTRGRARTVASNRITTHRRNVRARRLLTGQTVREERHEKNITKQKRKRKVNDDKDYRGSSSGKSKKSSRASSRDYVREKIENELKKVESELKKAREQMRNENKAKQNELVRPPSVAVHGNDLDLDDVFDPTFNSKEKTPPRSTIVDTPDVVGHIFDTCSIDISNVKLLKDGSLVRKGEEKPTPEKDVERKKTIRFDPSCDGPSDHKKDDSSLSDTKKSSKSGSNEHKLKSKESTDATCSKKSLEDDSRKERRESKSSKSKNIKDNGSNDSKDTHEKDGKEKGDSSIEFMKSVLKTIQDCESKSKEKDKDKEKGVKKDDKMMYHMKKRHSETMEKKAKADEIEQEVKAMKAADNAVDIKTFSTYEGVASFKIPKKPKVKKNESPEKKFKDDSKRISLQSECDTSLPNTEGKDSDVTEPDMTNVDILSKILGKKTSQEKYPSHSENKCKDDGKHNSLKSECSTSLPDMECKDPDVMAEPDTVNFDILSKILGKDTCLEKYSSCSGNKGKDDGKNNSLKSECSTSLPDMECKDPDVMAEPDTVNVDILSKILGKDTYSSYTEKSKCKDDDKKISLRDECGTSLPDTERKDPDVIAEPDTIGVDILSKILGKDTFQKKYPSSFIDTKASTSPDKELGQFKDTTFPSNEKGSICSGSGKESNYQSKDECIEIACSDHISTSPEKTLLGNEMPSGVNDGDEISAIPEKESSSQSIDIPNLSTSTDKIPESLEEESPSKVNGVPLPLLSIDRISTRPEKGEDLLDPMTGTGSDKISLDGRLSCKTKDLDFNAISSSSDTFLTCKDNKVQQSLVSPKNISTTHSEVSGSSKKVVDKCSRKRSASKDKYYDDDDDDDDGPVTKAEVLARCMRESAKSRNSVKKGVPLTSLEKKVKLYNEREMKKQHTEKVGKDRRKREKSRRERQKDASRSMEMRKALHKHDRKLEHIKMTNTTEPSHTLDKNRVHGGMKKTFKLCENLFGDENLEHDLIPLNSQSKSTINKDGKPRVFSKSADSSLKDYKTDSDSSSSSSSEDEKSEDDYFLPRKVKQNTVKNDVMGCIKPKTTEFDQQMKIVDMYSKYINPSHNLYDDSITAFTMQKGKGLKPNSSCTVSKSSSNNSNADTLEKKIEYTEVLDKSKTTTLGMETSLELEKQQSTIHVGSISGDADKSEFIKDENVDNVSLQKNFDIGPVVNAERSLEDKLLASISFEGPDKENFNPGIETGTLLPIDITKDKNQLVECTVDSNSKSIEMILNETEKIEFPDAVKSPENKLLPSIPFEVPNKENLNPRIQLGNVLPIDIMKDKNQLVECSIDSNLQPPETILNNPSSNESEKIGTMLSAEKNPADKLLTHIPFEGLDEKNLHLRNETDTFLPVDIIKDQNQLVECSILDSNLQSTETLLNNPVSSNDSSSGSNSSSGSSSSSKMEEIQEQPCKEPRQRRKLQLPLQYREDASKRTLNEHYEDYVSMDIKEIEDYSKFERNSPYSVIRPFTLPNPTSQAKVAVISPSFRENSPPPPPPPREPEYGYKGSIKSNESAAEVKESDRSYPYPWALKTSSWVLSTPTMSSGKKLSSQQHTHHNKSQQHAHHNKSQQHAHHNKSQQHAHHNKSQQHAHHKSQQNVHHNKSQQQHAHHNKSYKHGKPVTANDHGNKLKAKGNRSKSFDMKSRERSSHGEKHNHKHRPPKDKHKPPKDMDIDTIEKIKDYLKPYFRKRYLTKEQWKDIVKSSVRVIRSKPHRIKSDEDIKHIVRQNASPYLRIL